ncbi:hypothetical protein Gohar_018426, partial [Gossypium harknessii]|nr:hypothetical protein [Gossypium harknessii]
LKGKEKVDDVDCSWLALLNGVEASTSTRLVTEMQNKKMIEKEGLKSCHEAGREDPEKFLGMALEPPPNMLQVFKDCIQDLGESEIKLVIQKCLQVTNLRPQFETN